MNSMFNQPARLAILIVAMTCCVVGSAKAQSNSPSGPTDSQQRREPPPQAYQDCKGKQAGDVVQITTPKEGNISATCTNSSKGLFAKPERPPCNQEGAAKK